MVNQEYNLERTISDPESKMGGSFTAKLSPGEVGNLKPVVILGNKGREDAHYTRETLHTFMSPSRIVKYDCRKCKKEYKKSPIAEVTIQKSDAPSGIAVRVEYNCGKCKNYIYAHNLFSADSVDPKYIVLDETGDFVKPTSASIEERLKKALKTARKD